MSALKVKHRLAAFALTVGALAATPLALLAADAFVDVPDSNVHHNDIAWLEDAGVTLGCNPPANTEFCPGDPVLRQQMASFMRRLAENRVVDAATAVEAGRADEATNSDTLDGLHAEDLQPDCSPAYIAGSAWIDVRTVSATDFTTDGVISAYSCNGEDVLAKKSGANRLQVVIDDGMDDDTIGLDSINFALATPGNPMPSVGSQLLQCSLSVPPQILCASFDFYGLDGTPALPTASVFVVFYSR